MNVVMWVLVAVLAGLVAAYVMKRGGYGLAWDIALGLTGSTVLSWILQGRWVASDPGLVAVTLVAAVGAAGLIVAQRKIWPSHPGASRQSPADVAMMRNQRMDARRDTRSVGPMDGAWTVIGLKDSLNLRGEPGTETRPTKTVAFWCCVASAVLTMIVGFSWGGWVTGGTARITAESMAHQAVVTRLAPICVVQAGRDPTKAVKLVALKDESGWQRGKYVGKQGWATMPGEREPDRRVAEMCATLLMPSG
jgi:uncharacterized membrane protein YeaQ/YmgE (transglycosylase-associated protein family)